MGRSEGKAFRIEAVKSATIKVEWQDRWGEGGKDFRSVQELAEFLKSVPELAERFGYVPKIK
jgi:hypothetical protein